VRAEADVAPNAVQPAMIAPSASVLRK
jgi:hypothetical protein